MSMPFEPVFEFCSCHLLRSGGLRNRKRKGEKIRITKKMKQPGDYQICNTTLCIFTQKPHEVKLVFTEVYIGLKPKKFVVFLQIAGSARKTALHVFHTYIGTKYIQRQISLWLSPSRWWTLHTTAWSFWFNGLGSQSPFEKATFCQTKESRIRPSTKQQMRKSNLFNNSFCGNSS